MEYIKKSHITQTSEPMIKSIGITHRERIERGVTQAAKLWRNEDGTPETFHQFCQTHFIVDSGILKSTFDRFEKNMESVSGHFHEMTRDLRESMDLDRGPMLPVDSLFVQYAPESHANEDLFKTKIAFVALLNFPLHTLDDRLNYGHLWNRETWAQSRLTDYFSTRIPPEIIQARTSAYMTGHTYINHYNICMHHVLDDHNQRLFPAGLKLLSHWNLRDEIKGQYASIDGLPRQEMIQRIMEKIILQEIPQMVINNPALDWNLTTNEVSISPIQGGPGAPVPDSIHNRPESNERYAHLWQIFKAEHRVDPYDPIAPSLLQRKFQRYREIPEVNVVELLKSILTSPLIRKTGMFIQKRLGRKLRPFDIWYNGFKSRGHHQESELDVIISKKYPSPVDFQNDIPHLLQTLGFSQETASFLSSKIVVDPARGSGHAMAAGRREDQAHLRTRIPSTGMNYKGYNVAIHELGHNVEQVLSLNRIDHILLRGVPNTAFTEAFAFVFQNRHMELMDLVQNEPMDAHMKALDTLWSTYEIAAVALVDITVWHRMYDHPKADPAQLKTAVIQIARDIWNQYFAPIFGIKDIILLAIYSHMIDYGLYLPDYPLGHIIAFQIERYLKDKNLGEEMERMCILGAITPDAWMQAAVGGPISVEPLLEAAEEALDVVNF